ncbi:hypothetical protein OL229_10495 [Neisseriaceae bacterium JH1-16]|nr:hypothetical protein [Neisseriaceae bacterium JH1-16]
MSLDTSTHVSRMAMLRRQTGHVPYLRELVEPAGSITAAILMAQLEYWFERKPDGFYKYQVPVLSETSKGFYREGDSWQEELGMSANEFRTAFDRIGVRYNSKSQYYGAADKFKGKFYCSYIDKRSNVTRYFRNNQEVDGLLERLIRDFSEKSSCRRPTLVGRQGCELTGDAHYKSVEVRRSNFLESGVSDVDITEITTSKKTHTLQQQRPKSMPCGVAGYADVKFEKSLEDGRSLLIEIAKRHQLTVSVTQDLADEYCQRRLDARNGGGVEIRSARSWLSNLAKKAANNEPILDRGRLQKVKRLQAEQSEKEAERLAAAESENREQVALMKTDLATKLKAAPIKGKEQILKHAQKSWLGKSSEDQIRLEEAIKIGDISSLNAKLFSVAIEATKAWLDEQEGRSGS